MLESMEASAARRRHVSFRIAVVKNVAATLRNDPAIGAADRLEGHQS
jgi:hypothetical protein